MMFHPETTQLIARIRSGPAQAVLLTGEEGVGLLPAAKEIATSGQTLRIVEPDTSKSTPAIKVETVRELYDVTRSRSEGKQFVIINQAHLMTTQAQNAFLKLLEEPGGSIHFILATHSPQTLLSTIRSRAQAFHIRTISSDQSAELVAKQGVNDAAKKQQLLFIAQGLPEELARLMDDDEYFEQSAGLMRDARELLHAGLYDKLLIINSYQTDRQKALQLVQACLKIAQFSLKQKPSRQLVTQLERLLEVDEALRANTQVRLALTRLVV